MEALDNTLGASPDMSADPFLPGADDDEGIIVGAFAEWPEVAPAYVALSLFFLGGLVALFFAIRSRTWLLLTVTVTAWLEVAALSFRLAFIETPDLALYSGMQALLVMAPAFLPLVNYGLAGRLAMLGDAGHLCVPPWWASVFLGCAYAACAALNAVGAGMVSSTDLRTHDVGRNLMVVGLSLQLGAFAALALGAAWMQRSTAFALRYRVALRPPVWACLHATTALMALRTAFRLAEFSSAHASALATREEYLYALDVAPTLLCVAAYCACHAALACPAQLLPVQLVGASELLSLKVGPTADFAANRWKAAALVAQGWRAV
ncbi:hypothetical protein HYH03_013135 [Edaphochlamys debaryana]|uniref:Uncharacterized protein n=1 Tax=Edaphochlamys debaryana TaxID=47281 RepID=A0A835XWT1_9CHLO|nr:hypothetical protein HYH03_013135 [Edaphochlamys debaryana]|eukprot:KAG2488285.1 hypothetical protein HYH03_013135 [Edaphochlamys debaryana]